MIAYVNEQGNFKLSATLAQVLSAAPLLIRGKK